MCIRLTHACVWHVVLMAQERVSPMPRMQGAWKLAGGLAERGEDFAEV